MNIVKLRAIVTFLIFTLLSSVVFAYGGGGGQQRSCKKPSISNLSPSPSSIVPPNSEFSFMASADTRAKSIQVVIKGQEVDLDVSEQSSKRLLVKGKLPESIQEGHARINVSTVSEQKCPLKEGWLIKIEGK